MSHPFTYRRKKRSTNSIKRSLPSAVDELILKIKSLKNFLTEIPPLIFKVLDENCDKNNTKPQTLKPTENVSTHTVNEITSTLEDALVTDINDAREVEIELIREEEDSTRDMWSIEETNDYNDNLGDMWSVEEVETIV